MKGVKYGGFRAFPGECMEGVVWNGRPPWEIIRFWSCCVDFPHYGAPLNLVKLVIFGVFRQYLENAWEYMSRRERGRKHISDALRRVLSSFKFYWNMIYLNPWWCPKYKSEKSIYFLYLIVYMYCKGQPDIHFSKVGVQLTNQRLLI